MQRRFALALLLLPALAFSAPSYTLLDFPVTDGPVTSIAVGPDHVYIGGDFRRVGKRVGRTAFWDLAGNALLPLDPGIGGGDVKVALADGSGGWYLGGSFTSVSGATATLLAHLLPSGALDPAFNSPLQQGGYANILFMHNGSLYVGGNLNMGLILGLKGLIKVDPATGAYIPAFDPPYYVPNAVTGSGSSLYMGIYASGLQSGVLKLDDTTGLKDAGFDMQFNANFGNIYALAVSGSSLVVGGDFANLSLSAKKNLVMADLATGLVDAAYNPDPNGPVKRLAWAGGRIFAAGGFTWAGGLTRTALVALDAGGAGVAAFDAFLAPFTLDNIVGDGNHLLLSGGFSTVYGSPRARFARVAAATGIPDANDPGPFAPPAAMAVQGSTLLLAGPLGSVGGLSRRGLARIAAASALVDPAFDAALDGPVTDLLLNGSSLYASGGFSLAGGTAREGLAKLNAATGGLDVAFDALLLGSTQSMAMDGAGLYLGGNYLNINGVFNPKHLIRVSALNGAMDPGFNASTASGVTRLLLDGGSLYAAVQNFSNTRGVFKFSAASGALDGAFNNQFSGEPRSLVVTKRGLMVGGSFTQVQGKSRTGLARLNAVSGELDAAFSPALLNHVNTMLAAGPELYLGGYISNLMGQARGHLAKLDANEGLDAFNGAFSYEVLAMKFSPTADRIYVGGSFSGAAGMEAPNFAVYSVPAAAAWPSKIFGYLESPVDHDIVGPVPGKAGTPICAAFTNKPAAIRLTAYNIRGEKVADYDYAGGADACWDTQGVAPGFYYVRSEVTDLAGKRRERTHKVLITK